MGCTGRQLACFALGFTLGAGLAVRWLTRRASLITPPAFAPLLLSPLRLRYRDPARMVRFAGIRPDWAVLDLGCGNGAFTLELAKRARVVHAVDVQPAMLKALERRLIRADAQNVCLHAAPATRLPFDDGSFDAVFMISVLPMLHDRDAALREVWRVLKPHGVLVIGEERIEPEYVSARTTTRWVEPMGFRWIARDANLLCFTLKFAKTQTERRTTNDK